MSSQYRTVKAEILGAVEAIRAARPEAAEYLEEHLVFDDEKETFAYTGDAASNCCRFTEWGNSCVGVCRAGYGGDCE
jgi:hypothetical protein